MMENAIAVCGVAYPGELLVIMGSSGAGKTTLLNALTFRSGRGVTASGVMAANGRRVSSTTLTSRTAYVQQDDLFVGTLTVKEHLSFQAMVRMDRRIPMEQRFDRVYRVINEVRMDKSATVDTGTSIQILKSIIGCLDAKANMYIYICTYVCTYNGMFVQRFTIVI